MDANKNTAMSLSSAEVKIKIKKYFKLLSWNIDGLDRLEETMEVRTRGVVDVVKR